MHCLPVHFHTDLTFYDQLILMIFIYKKGIINNKFHQIYSMFFGCLNSKDRVDVRQSSNRLP